MFQEPALPEGVVKATGEELTQQPRRSDLPVLCVINSHVGQPEQKYGAEVTEKLWAEYHAAKERYGKDFSCGKALLVNYSGEATYWEPLDLDQKVSAHLVAFLKDQGVEP